MSDPLARALAALDDSTRKAAQNWAASTFSLPNGLSGASDPTSEAMYAKLVYDGDLSKERCGRTVPHLAMLAGLSTYIRPGVKIHVGREKTATVRILPS